MKRVSHILAICTLLLCTSAGAFAAPADDEDDSLRIKAEYAAKERQRLALATTAKDSIDILYNIFDLTNYSDRMDNIKAIYDVARRSGNEKVQLDMLRHWANAGAAMKDESIGREALMLVDKLPESEDQRQTRTFIRASIATTRIPVSEAERSTMTINMLRNLSQKPIGTNPYDDIVRLFGMIHLMAGQTQGMLIESYLDQLNDAIEKLPHTNNTALLNKFYTLAATTYWRNDEANKSLAADRKLLETIDRMQREYKAKGRIYRNLDVNRYVVMRRMMRNYNHLRPEEVDSLNAAMRQLAAGDPDIHHDYYAVSPLGLAVSYIKQGKYDLALPLVKQLADRAVDVYNRRYYMSLLSDVAARVGDEELSRKADYAYITALEEYIKYKSSERIRELQIVYDINNIKRQSTIENLEHQRQIALITTVALIVVLLMFVPMVILYVRFRKMSKQLAKANEKLKTESENLLQAQSGLIAARDHARDSEESKTQLINYLSQEIILPLNAVVEYSRMIVDNVQGPDTDYLQKFCAIVDDNAHLLQEITADVHEYTMLESPKVNIRIAPVHPNYIGSISSDNIRPRLKPGVELIYIPDERHNTTLVNTDARRVEVVLMALLSNAAKFTSAGKITLVCKLNEESGELTYTVTDTGIGIPPDMAEKIFDRYERLDPDSQGSGLGLPVCRMIARLLNGQIYNDPTFRHGARFVFTIPVTIDTQCE